MEMDFDQAVAAIAALAPRGWRLGLDRMQAFVDRAGLLKGSRPNFIQVAGTNGKGSVTATLQSLMVASGKNTGGYFSPYVYDVRERVQHNQELISPEEFAAWTSELLPIAAAMDETEYAGVTEFEFKTALGFLAFERWNCDWVALEVGLGGRLDASSVCTPKCGVIVSIGLDHVDILGQSYAEIAREKAGICKPNLPLVIGEMPAEATAAIREVANGLNCDVWQIGREMIVERRAERVTLQTPTAAFDFPLAVLAGPHQIGNAALAVAAAYRAGLEFSQEQLDAGILNTRIPGRFEVIKIGAKTFILDGAHNAESASALATTLSEKGYSKFALVTGMLHGHDPVSFLQPLRPLIEALFVCPVSFGRTRTPQEVAEKAQDCAVKISVCGSALEAIRLAAAENNVVVVSGSFYLVGELGTLLRSGAVPVS